MLNAYHDVPPHERCASGIGGVEAHREGGSFAAAVTNAGGLGLVGSGYANAGAIRRN